MNYRWRPILAAALVAALPACGPGEREEIQARRGALVTPTFVQQSSNVPQSSPTSVAKAYATAQVAGDLNVVIIGWNNSTSSVNTVADSKGNSYQLAVGPTRRTGILSQSIYYAPNVAAATANSNTVTVTFNAATAFPDLRILSYRGIDKVNPLDAFASANGSSMVSSTGSLTTTFPTDLLVAGNTVETETTAAGTNFTSRVITNPDGDIAEDRVVTSTGTYSTTTNLGHSGQWVMQMVAFRALDNTAPGTPTNLAASVVSSSQINLSWTAPTDDIGVTGYSVERCQGAACSSFAEVGTPATVTFSNTGLAGNTSYSFRVRAKDAAGNLGAFSTTVSATTQVQTCTSNAQCGTGFCADGVCCNSACGGGCGVCNLAGFVGTCKPKGDNTSCTDNNACTLGDVCMAGVCTAGTNVACPSDECHTAGVCDPTTGLCSTQTSLPDHSNCNDRNSCTLHSECIKGTCIPEDPITGCTIPNAPYYAPLTNLGSKQGSSSAVDINNSGQVTGVDAHFSYQPAFSFGTGQSGFIWKASDGMTSISQPNGVSLSPNAMNASGVVVGTGWDSVNGGVRAFRYDSATHTTDLMPVPFSGAMGINDAGQFTGVGIPSGYQTYRALGSAVQWIPPPSGSRGINGWSIDTGGNITGFVSRADLSQMAFRYTDAGGLIHLNELIPSGGGWDPDPDNGASYLTVGYGVNWDGTKVVGTGRRGSGLNRGFVMTLGSANAPGSGTIKTIDLPSGLPAELWVIPRRINRAGEVVGSLNGDGGATAAKAFIWIDGTGTFDLNQLVDPASGWVLRGAFGINDNREVVGWGMLDGQQRAFKIKVPDLSPCPAPDACHGPGVRDLRGTCSYPAGVDGTTCNDGTACTSGDHCQAGACVGTTVVACPGDACRPAGVCDPSSGLCSIPAPYPGTPAHPGGPSCDDGNRCTIGDFCNLGTCMPGPTDTGCRGPTDTYYAPLVDLGSTQGASYATDINNAGEVIGSDARVRYARVGAGGNLPTTGFRWTADGGTVQLPRSSGTFVFPHAINATGAIAGATWDSSGGDRAFSFDRSIDTQLQFFAMLSGNGTAINDAGVVGGSGYFSSVGGAMFRGTASSFQVIAGPPNVLASGGNAIDPSGNLFGYTIRPDRTTAPVRYTDARGIEYLSQFFPPSGDWNLDPGVADFFVSVADGTNGRQIVGSAHTSRGFPRGFVLTLGADSLPGSGVVKQIPMLSEFPDDANLGVTPHDINQAGEVVGAVNAAGIHDVHAFIWVEGTGIVDLNELIDPASGWILAGAYAINDHREVVGYGWLNGTPELNGQERAFKMTVPDLRPCDAPDLCHTQAPRDLRTGQCAAPVSIPGIPSCQQGLALRVDGVVDIGGGQFMAVFGFNSIAQASMFPSVNEVVVDGVTQAGYRPAPPAWLPPGNHPGAFLPTFTGGQTIGWRVDGQLATASASLPRLPHVPIGTTGYGVQIGGALIVIKADLGPYASAPADPTAAPRPTTGAEYFGTLKGDLNVAPSGAATYSLPIAIPHGAGGMAPNLSLIYNSQGGDGIAGQGWELTALSMVHRCPKTKVQDGYSTGLRMRDTDSSHPVTDNTLKDGICLDGKRLFEQRNAGRLTYYVPETKDLTTITREMDVLGESSFEVMTKSGETRHYGLLQRDRILGHENAANPFDHPEMIWLLDKVVDNWGNYYDIHYNNDNEIPAYEAEGIKITKISYTGHLAGWTQDDRAVEASDPVYDITFAYEDRPDIRHFRLDTVRVTKKSRLTAITVPGGYYSLSYMPDDPMLPSRLQQVQYCHTAWQCMDPLVFDWNWGNYGWNPEGDANEVGQANTYALPVRIDGHYDGDSSKPENWRSSGAQFIDLDGDGLVDLVFAKEDTPRSAWKNNGHGWDPAPAAWIPPVDLYKTDGKRANTLVSDFDADGLPDLVAAKICHIVHGTTTDSDGNTIPEVYESCDPTPPVPVVWLNHIKQGGGWVRTNVAGTIPSDWGAVDFTLGDTLADMNGDGRPDLVHIYNTERNTPYWKIRHNLASGWAAPDVSYDPGAMVLHDITPEDVNRDGLTDLVLNRKWTGAEGEVLLNTGSNPSGGDGTNVFEYEFTANDTLFSDVRGAKYVGDIDGDGMRDSVMRYQNSGSPFAYHSGVLMGTWNGYAAAGASDYSVVLDAFTPTNATSSSDPHSAFAIADVNGDGLGDLILYRDDGGQLLVNNGTTWVDQNGATTWENSAGPNTVPVVPSEWNPTTGGAFVDLNGDGITDLVQATGASGTTVTHAWINTSRPPVITKFPNGLARKTEVAYQVITTEEARVTGTYTGASDLAYYTTHFTAPMRVVASVSAEDSRGIGVLAMTTYRYFALRASANGRGPMGFERVLVDEPEPSGVTTITQYGQGYPYAGMPTFVGRYRRLSGGDLRQLSATATTYCDVTDTNQCSPPEGSGTRWTPGTSLFVYPQTVTNTTNVLDSSGGVLEAIVTKSTFTYDTFGNNTVAVVETSRMRGEETLDHYMKTTTNSFDGVNLSDPARGQPSKTVVRTERDEDQHPLTHTTAFHYAYVNNYYPPPPAIQGGQPRTLALVKTVVEPGAGIPIELHTAYGYDEFGNVTTTTACASEFSSCAPGAVGPPLYDLPFRTQTVSYRVADYTPGGAVGAVTSLSYHDGLFPVKTTNAVGHVEYTAYDPVYGGLLQRTGPNGLNTCYTYDVFGRQQTETERCGLPTGATTSSYRYRTTPTDPDSSAIVTVTDSPNGATTWAYYNDAGLVVNTRGRSFNGGFTEVAMEYDQLGRKVSESKPHIVGPAPIYYTSSTYDDFGRVKETIQDLGDVGDPGLFLRDDTITTYDGLTITTTHTVAGQSETRTEAKNALGKIDSVTDATGATIWYVYDVEGNLKQAQPLGGNQVTISYDARGRKQSTQDPDLGNWTYEYSGFGDLTAQTDAKGQRTEMWYDRLGRVGSRSDGSSYAYDVAPGAGVGKPASMVGPSDDRMHGECDVPYLTENSGAWAGRWFTYTVDGLVDEEFECIDGETFSTKHEYDALGREMLVRYPEVRASRFTVGYHYTNLGFLNYVTDASTGNTLWVAKNMNAFGQVVDEQTANGVETVSSRGLGTGWLMSRWSVAHADSETQIQGWAHRYDEAGNLRWRGRSDGVNGADSEETFGYDTLNRLLTSKVDIPAQSYNVTQLYDYDALGNVLHKDGAAYTYGGCGAGPHAVCTVGGSAPFTYDGNGNMTAGNGHGVQYDPMNKVKHIEGGGTVDLIYGADGNRVVQETTADGAGASSAERTVYVGMNGTGRSRYERTTRTAGVQHVHFIYAGGAHDGNAFALRVITDAGSATLPVVETKFHHFDHLGSITATSDERGHVVSAAWGGPDAGTIGYDPWGARRSPEGRAAAPATFHQQVGHREFTGHETIPGVGLVNMNGRVYDPVIGRFLSADPTVQFVADLQSYNRYSYVLNNPLRYTDATGLSVDGWVRGTFGVIFAVAGIAACAGTGGAGCVMMTMVLMWTTSISMASAGASFEQIVAANAIGMFAGGIGSAAGGLVAQSAIGALVGGAVSGAINGALTTEYNNWRHGNGGNLGENIMEGATKGAISAGVSAAIGYAIALSQASAAASQGGGGTGAAQAEASARTNAASPGSSRGKSLDALLDSDRTGLSPGFMKRMQPVFDDLNVDLSDVEVQIGGKNPCSAGNACTVGDKIYLPASAADPRNYDYTAGQLIHELGHVVQFANAPGLTEGARLGWLNSELAAQKEMAVHMYGDLDARYWQTDPVLKNASLGFLTKTDLISPSFMLEAQADRFRDVVLASRSSYGF